MSGHQETQMTEKYLGIEIIQPMSTPKSERTKKKCRGMITITWKRRIV